MKVIVIAAQPEAGRLAALKSLVIVTVPQLSVADTPFIQAFMSAARVAELQRAVNGVIAANVGATLSVSVMVLVAVVLFVH